MVHCDSCSTGRLGSSTFPAREPACLPVFKMAARAPWKDYQKNMAQKRRGKAKNLVLERRSMIVQRLSSEVSGKAQKYARQGAREFVPYEYEDFTLNNVKAACKQHFFGDQTDEYDCDVLVGELGPSCSSVDQLPDTKVIYVRFIDETEEDDGSSGTLSGSERSRKSGVKRKRPVKATTTDTKRFVVSGSNANVSDAEKNPPKKTYPKSLSAIDMLRLGHYHSLDYVAAPSQVECAEVVELLKSKYGEGETTEEICPKCERTFQCLSAGVFADESGCVRVYSTGNDMCDVCVKDEEFYSYEY